MKHYFLSSLNSQAWLLLTYQRNQGRQCKSLVTALGWVCQKCQHCLAIRVELRLDDYWVCPIPWLHKWDTHTGEWQMFYTHTDRIMNQIIELWVIPAKWPNGIGILISFHVGSSTWDGWQLCPLFSLMAVSLTIFSVLLFFFTFKLQSAWDERVAGLDTAITTGVSSRRSIEPPAMSAVRSFRRELVPTINNRREAVARQTAIRWENHKQMRFLSNKIANN